MVGILTLLTYGILRRRQLPGGKAFCPGPENTVTVKG